ncbi:conserved hypothetical protein [Coccidioides posadasii str. Silveira]|uniref:Uncharacterized protein n=1 Tax=Coccidioides posadasii (strain RMSCC 757 / Silveira) TaxID=443226 RepID=E9CT29_COCPS|nr:conserved hypothetical protein [Coccidioides posadasii str. Silveira]
MLEPRFPIWSGFPQTVIAGSVPCTPEGKGRGRRNPCSSLPDLAETKTSSFILEIRISYVNAEGCENESPKIEADRAASISKSKIKSEKQKNYGEMTPKTRW